MGFRTAPISGSSEDSGYERYIITILTLIATIVVLIFIGLIIQTIHPENKIDAGQVLQKYALKIEEFRPESVERAQYVTSVLLFIPICAGFYWVFKRFVPAIPPLWLWRIYHFLSLLTPFCILVLTYAAFKHVSIYPFFNAAGFTLNPALSVAGFAILWLLVKAGRYLIRRWNDFNWVIEAVYFGAGLGIVYLLVLPWIFNEADPWVSHIHFQAYYESVVQVYLGRALLVNLDAQYGLYPVFLLPIFRLIHPPSVFAFTVLMGILIAIMYACLLLFLRLTIRNRAIAFCGFIAVAFYTRYGPIAYFGSGPYFQYLPHRMLFPILVVLLAWFYLSAKSQKMRKTFYFATMLTCAVAVLWNQDSGIMALGGWCFLLALQELLRTHLSLRRRILNIVVHGLVVLTFLVGAVLAFTIYTLLISGSWPDLQRLAKYSDLFYGLGYYMLPMPGFIYPWILVILCYVIALYQAIRHAVDHFEAAGAENGALESAEENRKIIRGMLAVSGVGLFTYYQGRSAETNLIGSSWPAFLLLVAFTDDLAREVKKRFAVKPIRADVAIAGAGQFIFYGCLCFFLFSSIIAMWVTFPAYSEVIAARQDQIRVGGSPMIAEQAAFIRSNSSPSDEVFILSDYAAVLYLNLGKPNPLPVPGFGELALQSDVQLIRNYLQDPSENTKVFIDTQFTRFKIDALSGLYLPAFKVEKTLPGDRFVLMTPK